MADDGFGARLKELREQKGLTQLELATAAGMHKFGIAIIKRAPTQQGMRVIKKNILEL